MPTSKTGLHCCYFEDKTSKSSESLSRVFRSGLPKFSSLLNSFGQNFEGPQLFRRSRTTKQTRNTDHTDYVTVLDRRLLASFQYNIVAIQVETHLFLCRYFEMGNTASRVLDEARHKMELKHEHYAEGLKFKCELEIRTIMIPFRSLFHS
ncbi:unnamed protein product [Rhizophagus irregularis]|nr:unnamed protein product [Rhizophagus irregularis]